MPPKLKKKGRPKGAEKTVITCLLRKRNKIISFISEENVFKYCISITYIFFAVILQWFVDPAIADIVLSRKGLIQEDTVEIHPERITASCLDDRVHLQSCKSILLMMVNWLAMQNVVEMVKKNPAWYCSRCTYPINDENEDSLQCDSSHV